MLIRFVSKHQNCLGMLLGQSLFILDHICGHRRFLGPTFRLGKEAGKGSDIFFPRPFALPVEAVVHPPFDLWQVPPCLPQRPAPPEVFHLHDLDKKQRISKLRNLLISMLQNQETVKLSSMGKHSLLVEWSQRKLNFSNFAQTL